MKFDQFMQSYKRTIFNKKICEKCGLETSSRLFNFQRIFFKKEYQEVCVLILTSFDSFANIYLI